MGNLSPHNLGLTLKRRTLCFRKLHFLNWIFHSDDIAKSYSKEWLQFWWHTLDKTCWSVQKEWKGMCRQNIWACHPYLHLLSENFLEGSNMYSVLSKTVYFPWDVHYAAHVSFIKYPWYSGDFGSILLLEPDHQ